MMYVLPMKMLDAVFKDTFLNYRSVTILIISPIFYIRIVIFFLMFLSVLLFILFCLYKQVLNGIKKKEHLNSIVFFLCLVPHNSFSCKLIQKIIFYLKGYIFIKISSVVQFQIKIICFVVIEIVLFFFFVEHKF